VHVADLFSVLFFTFFHNIKLGKKLKPVKMGVKLYRRMLQAMAIITFIGGSVVCGFGIFLSKSISNANDESPEDAGTIALSLATLGAICALISIGGLIGACMNEKTQLLMVYFYTNIMISVVLLLFAYMAVVPQNSLEIWIRVNWNTPALNFLRRHSCCQTFQSATDFLNSHFILIGVVTFVSIVCILVALICVVKIVTIPIVMRHMLTVVNLIFIALGTSMSLRTIYIIHNGCL